MTAHQMMLGEFADDIRDNWATPQSLFDEINIEGKFTVDSCATAINAKMPRFWSPTDDGICKDWRQERVWVNPPYSNIAPWVTLAKTARLACLLVPVASDAKWFHAALHSCSLIDFFRGRIDFVPPPGVEASTCNGRHCLMWFDRQRLDDPCFRSRDAKTGNLI